MFESCLEIRARFWDYLDGTCERSVFSSIRFHLEYCSSCRQEIARMEMVSDDLKSLRTRRVPPELALRMRVQLSRHLHQNLLGRLLISLDNVFRPLLLPASGGFAAAVVCFVLIVGSQLSPTPGLASVTTEANKPPRVQQLAPINFPLRDDGIVVMTNIDAEGRVLSYQILSGSASSSELRNLDRMMYFSHFRPAMMDGQPTDGQVVLSLRRITVRG